jgi:hypothetical protein
MDDINVGIQAVSYSLNNDGLAYTYNFDLKVNPTLYGDNVIGFMVREKYPSADGISNILDTDSTIDMTNYTPIDSIYYADVFIKGNAISSSTKTIKLDTTKNNGEITLPKNTRMILTDNGGVDGVTSNTYTLNINTDNSQKQHILIRSQNCKITKPGTGLLPNYANIYQGMDVTVISDTYQTSVEFTALIFEDDGAGQYYFNSTSNYSSWFGNVYNEFYLNQDSGTNYISGNRVFIYNIPTGEVTIKLLVTTSNTLEIYINNVLQTVGGDISWTDVGIKGLNFYPLSTANIWRILNLTTKDSGNNTVHSFEASSFNVGDNITEINSPFSSWIGNPVSIEIKGGVVNDVVVMGDSYSRNYNSNIGSFSKLILESTSSGFGFYCVITSFDEDSYKFPMEFTSYDLRHSIDYVENTIQQINYNLPEQSTFFTCGPHVNTVSNPTSYYTNLEVVSPFTTLNDDNDGDAFENEQHAGGLIEGVEGKVVLVQRGEYNHIDKVLNVQNSGAIGIMYYNSNIYESGYLYPYVPTGYDITIPIVSISNWVGHQILESIRKGHKVLTTISIDEASSLPSNVKVFYENTLSVGDKEVQLAMVDSTLPSGVSIIDTTRQSVNIESLFSTTQVRNYFYNSSDINIGSELTIAEFNGLRVTGQYDTQYVFKLYRISTDTEIRSVTIDGSGFPYELADRVTGDDGTQYDLNIHGIGSVLFSVDDLSVVIPCLTETCNVLTPNGYVNVSGLKEGEMVITSDDRQVPITRIFKSVSTMLPHLIKAGQYGSVPMIDTHLSGCHAYKVGNKWRLPKKENLPIEWNSETVTYYHIELPDYYNDHLVVNGLTTESWDGYLPNDIRPHMWVKNGKNRTSVGLKKLN